MTSFAAVLFIVFSVKSFPTRVLLATEMLSCFAGTRISDSSSGLSVLLAREAMLEAIMKDGLWDVRDC